ncbi:hypothetical protein [Bradyrhizobium sacchari]|uniref:hypothetical protein n=1 Tax=Bradyrhizobium sacchari TaxID=1399419 RepID=UPI0013747E18|nr:hypothetical protein [Bradyrhizobium sacchari]
MAASFSTVSAEIVGRGNSTNTSRVRAVSLRSPSDSTSFSKNKSEPQKSGRTNSY